LNTLEMNVELLKTVLKFNELRVDSTAVEIRIPIEKTRNYFEVKAMLADTLDDAYNSLRGLAVITNIPFISLKSDNPEGSSGIISFKDFMGLTKPFTEELVKLELVSESDNRVNILEKSTI